MTKSTAPKTLQLFRSVSIPLTQEVVEQTMMKTDRIAKSPQPIPAANSKICIDHNADANQIPIFFPILQIMNIIEQNERYRYEVVLYPILTIMISIALITVSHAHVTRPELKGCQRVNSNAR